MRPPRTSDVGALLASLRRNDAHLRPWSPLRAGADRRPTLAFVARDVAAARRSWRRDDGYTFFAFEAGLKAPRVVGRVTLGKVIRGPFQNAFLGYWIDVERQGEGLVTEAVGAVLRFAFGPLGLHRVQAGGQFVAHPAPFQFVPHRIIGARQPVFVSTYVVVFVAPPAIIIAAQCRRNNQQAVNGHVG